VALKSYIFRKSVRRPIRLNGLISSENGSYIAKTQTIDLSEHGAQLKLDRAVALPIHFCLSLSEKGDVRRLCELVWRSATSVGVRFIDAKQLRALRSRMPEKSAAR
jgi:hypothetical protein